MEGALFCSIFDRSFAARWLVMQRSLLRHSPGARALAFCLDDQARDVVDRLGLPGVGVMTLAELEAHDAELAAVRGTRSALEYLFTVKPCLYRHLLATGNAAAVVHVDADMMFFSDPVPLLRELDSGSVLLMPSGHSPSMPHLDEVYGAYQSGLIAFRSDQYGRAAAARWREQCLEWCGAVPEPGRWANKRYLNEWPSTLEGVRVVDETGLGTAAWSVGRHELAERAGQMLVDGRPLVLFHYSGMSFAGGAPWLLRLGGLTPPLRYQDGAVPFSWGHGYHRPAPRERELIWEPYARELSAALATVRAAGAPGPDGLGRPWIQFREIVLRRRLLWGAAWGIRRVLDACRRHVRANAVRRWASRGIGALDALRKRWRIE
jgi:nucleotide-diphospho-sugar transferase